MKIRRILLSAVISVMVTAGISSALSLRDFIPEKLRPSQEATAPQETSALPENALIPRPEESVYFVLKLDDTGSFMRWLASEDNINIFMPLVLKSKDSNDIMAGIEFFRAFAEKTPLKSAAIIAGAYDPDKKQAPFFQMAFTADESISSSVRKIADGTAEDSDFAKIILGNDNPITAIAQTMIKAEKLPGNVYQVDNELFVKADGDIILVSMSENELEIACNTLKDSGAGLFSKVTRKFTDKNFLYVHADYNVVDKLDTDNSLASADKVAELFDKPLVFEMGFTSKPDKFMVSFTFNLIEAVKKEYAAKRTAVPSVKGSHMTVVGTKSPLMAVSGYITLSAIKDATKDGADLWKEIVRQMRVRFGISEGDFTSLFTGPFSLTVGDSVTYEGMKIPALYISQTGAKGAAGKIFSLLAKTPHFKKAQEGILQLDPSISPVSCLVQDKGETLGINFAELSSLAGTPEIKPALRDLMNESGISAFWIDFAGIRDWLMDDENGVFAALLPMAKIFGYSEIAESVMDVLRAEFSVPSFSFRAEDIETFRFEFANAKIDPKNGLFAKLVGIYQKFSK